MEYIKYLLNNKSKLTYCAIIISFVLGCFYVCLTQVESFIGKILGVVLISTILIFALLQPYLEYKGKK